MDILNRYSALDAVQQIEPLGNAGGFSGSRLWRITAGDERLCLRRWPAHQPSRARLSWIHRLLFKGRTAGLDFLPVPVMCRDGNTYAEQGGHLWELSPWMPGEANFHADPTVEKLSAALRSLAQFHGAVAVGEDRPLLQPSPSMTQRLDQVRRLERGGFDQLSQALSQLNWPEFRQLGIDLLKRAKAASPEVRQRLEGSTSLVVPLQPAIRDIWHDHVLFEGDRVRGIVDFGAMRQESVAADLARLVGSLVGQDIVKRRTAISAYESVRPLSNSEHQLIEAFAGSTSMISGINWIQWVAVEGKTFEEPGRVLARLRSLLDAD